MILFKFLFTFLRRGFVENSWNSSGWWDEEPDRSSLTEAEIKIFHDALNYILENWETFNCKEFQSWWKFFNIRTRVLNIISRNHLRLAPLDIFKETEKWKKIWLEDSRSKFVNWILRKSLRNYVNISDFSKASDILNTKMKEQEREWISKIRGKSVPEKLKFIEKFPQVFSDKILGEYLNIDLYALFLTEKGALSYQFMELIKRLYQSSTTYGHQMFLNRFIKSLRSHFDKHLKVNNQCADLLRKFWGVK